jgi:hypothetical protein
MLQIKRIDCQRFYEFYHITVLVIMPLIYFDFYPLSNPAKAGSFAPSPVGEGWEGGLDNQ